MSSAQGINVEDAFCAIADLFYERLKKEDTIDARRKEDFAKDIDNAPALTHAERDFISSSMKLAEEVSAKANRVSGTVNEPVEKFLWRSEKGGAAVAMSVAKMDVSAVSLVAELWLLDTYAKKVENKNRKICEVWSNLNGTRGQQYTTSLGLPGGFKDRLFETWFTWEMTIDEEGRSTFIIAFAPFEIYEGMHHEVIGAEKMVEATTRGVFIVKELTENTCECTRAQQGYLKFSSAMPVSALDLIAKK
ncbi:hypothetical protein TL16_g11048 [Triparma laevis f. inornata]|uniref:Uncharacterized protein n=1 Tax=Triparma laevis f. inornata TaxID=1714386 RepID=A0A9W7BHN1_9STRA|nr:hypothetical protein TL16_g11048 [Triparma laevis f. inornata]